MPTEKRLDSFYGLLDELSDRIGGPRLLADCNGRMGWPKRGVYFFMEPGEVRRNGAPRVVRIGTHALTDGSRSTLWGRLRQHRGSTGGRNPGGGNHRGSIFRLHIGTALLASDPTLADDPARETWGRGNKATADIKALEQNLERRVSTHIGTLPFLWLEVNDPPGNASERGLIESSSIALLSNLADPNADPPPPTWLGHHADRQAVRESGLWNVNHVQDPVDPDFVPVLTRWVRCGSSQPTPGLQGPSGG